MSAQQPQRARVASEKKIDLRLVVIPTSIWQPQQRCGRKSADKEGQNVGFMRVPPDMSLKNVRLEFHQQLDENALPTEFVFLRCVGDFLTLVSKKQEVTLKAKSYAPPYTSTPDIFVMSTECISSQMMSSLATAERIVSPVVSPMSPEPKDLPHVLETRLTEPPSQEPQGESSAGLGTMAAATMLPLNYGGHPEGTGTSLSTEVNLPPSSLLPAGYGSSMPHFSISLSPMPSPQPPSEPRDPSIRRSPRPSRVQYDRTTPSFDLQPTTATTTTSFPARGAGVEFGAPAPFSLGLDSLSLSGGPMGISPSRSLNSSPLPPLDVEHRHEFAFSDAAATTAPPVHLYLNQGSGDLSLQLGGQAPGSLLQTSPSGLANIPRVDIRIASPSPWNRTSALPPLDTQEEVDLGPRGSDSGVEPDTSPTSLLGSMDVFSSRDASRRLHQQEVDVLAAKLAELRSNRAAMEQRKKELIGDSQHLEKETQRQKKAAEEEWKKKYLQEKRRTVPLQTTCDDMRRKLSTLHNKPAQQRGRQAQKEASKGTETLNNRIICQRLEKETGALQNRVEVLRAQFEAEQQAKTQMVQECKQLRDELTDKKITKTLIKKT